MEIVKTVRIETGSGERSVKSLRKEISDLRDALLNMDKGGEEWKKTAAELTKAQEDLNSVMRAGKDTADADATSIAGMEQRYKSLYQTYRLLSDEQRKTAEGMSMQKELAELSKNLNSTKKDAGNFKDNIGHYADDMQAAFSNLGLSVGGLATPFKLATTAGTGFKGVMDLIAKHPILLAITALVGIFMKLKDAIAGNEELQQRMNKVMAAFKPIGDVMAQVLDKIAGLAVSVAEGIAKVVTWVNNLFGATRKLSDAELELADRENALNQTRRETAELNTAEEARVQELMEEASLTDDMVEKEKLLQEAREIQTKINERNLALKQEEYEVIKKTNELTPSSTEDLNKESEALQAVNKARADGERSLRRINNQIKSAHNSQKSATDDAKNGLDEILKRLEENSKTEIQKLTEKYEEEKALLKKYHKDTTALEKEYQETIKRLQYDTESERVQALMAARESFQKNYLIPSTAAYKNALATAENNLETFHKDLKEKFGSDNPFNIGLGNFFEGGKELAEALEKAIKEYGRMSEEAKEPYEKYDEWLRAESHTLTAESEYFNKTYNAGITGLLNITQARERLNEVEQDFIKNIDEKQRALDTWNSSIEEQRIEVEAFKKQMDNQPFWELIYGDSDDYDKYATKLGDMENEERRFLEHRAEMVEKSFNELKGKVELMPVDEATTFEDNLNTLGYTLNEYYDMEREYYEALDELRQHNLENLITVRERQIELNENLKDSIFELGAAHLDSISSIVDTYRTLLDAYKRDGEMSEKEAKRKANTLKWLEGIEAAVAVSQIVADTASGWMSINKSLAAEYVLNAETAAATGPAAAATKAALDAKSLATSIIRKAALVTNGVTAAAAAVGKSIASIKSLGAEDSGSGGGGSISAAPQLIDSTPYSYTRELQTDVEREEQLNTPIYVKVTDIESAQAQVRVTTQETTF